MSATPVLNNVDPAPVTIVITAARVQNLIDAVKQYGGPVGVRIITDFPYPGGIWTDDVITWEFNNKTLTFSTFLSVAGPGLTIGALSNAGIIDPPLKNIAAGLVIPGVNDFNFVPKITPPTPPRPSDIRFVGGEIRPGTGRFYALNSALDKFVDGSITWQDGKSYQKIIVPGPFGNSPEWDEITVIGPPVKNT